MCKELLIPPGTQNYVVRMRLYDTNKHLLCLTIRIILRAQGALKILISAPYWLVNKTGNVPCEWNVPLWTPGGQPSSTLSSVRSAPDLPAGQRQGGRSGPV